MALSVDLSNIQGEISQMEIDLREEAEAHIKVKTINAFAALKLATPVDTGQARQSWVLTTTYKPDGVKMSNKTDYIERLNEGSSKQAPSNFIEQVIKQHLGVIPVLVYSKGE